MVVVVSQWLWILLLRVMPQSFNVCAGEKLIKDVMKLKFAFFFFSFAFYEKESAVRREKGMMKGNAE